MAVPILVDHQPQNTTALEVALPHPVGASDLMTLVRGSKPTTPPDVPVGKGHLPMG